MGTAIDVWTAFREGALSSTFVPWIGYLFLLEDSEKSRIPIRTYEPHFKVLPEFSSASYATRYEVFLRKLVRERHYTATAFLLSDREKGLDGAYSEPANDLNFENFARSLTAHVAAYKA